MKIRINKELTDKFIIDCLTFAEEKGVANIPEAREAIVEALHKHFEIVYTPSMQEYLRVLNGEE